MSWKADLSKSTQSVLANEALICKIFNGGKIHSIEQRDDHLFVLFDRCAGLDFLLEKKGDLYGIATRVQYDKAYDTFTIRYSRDTGSETEYAKRLRQISNGGIYPTYTLQMYCESSTHNAISIGICRTQQLFEYIQSNEQRLVSKLRRSNNSSFIHVRWLDLNAAYKMGIWRR